MRIESDIILGKVKRLVSDGKADRVFAWKKGNFCYDTEPSLFTDNYVGFTYDDFCAANLCKFMINESKKDGKTLVLIKPCDSKGLALLEKEHRINRERIYALGVPCAGKIDMDKIRENGVKGVIGIEEEKENVSCNGDENLIIKTLYGDKIIPKKSVLYDKCLSCTDKEHVGCDEVFMPELSEDTYDGKKFEGVKKIENMPSDERFSFWRSQLSKCIRCNACRNVCPVCSCVKCIFDNDNSGIASKANSDDFEENLYHIIRAFHVCGRCVDCGECSRVCPEKIPLHLLNRKYIKDIKELYGYEKEPALLTFTKSDAEPSVIYERGEKNV